MIGEILWMLFMLAMITATVVVAMKERKAQAKAKAKLAAPQPLDDDPAFADPANDGFGEDDPVDSFGMDMEEIRN